MYYVGFENKFGENSCYTIYYDTFPIIKDLESLILKSLVV